MVQTIYIEPNTGNLGIGTATPLRPLHIQGDSIITGNVGIGTTTPLQPLHIQGGSIITGNVGIGTTNPQTALHVNGSIRGVLTSSSVISTSSGTSFTLPNIPSWTKRITFMVKGISISSNGSILLQLATSSGIVTTGYGSISSYINTGGGAGAVGATNGFNVAASGPNQPINGIFILTLQNASTNSWTCTYQIFRGADTVYISGAGTIDLSSLLTYINITTSAGNIQFNAGSFGAFYEG